MESRRRVVILLDQKQIEILSASGTSLRTINCAFIEVCGRNIRALEITSNLLTGKFISFKPAFLTSRILLVVGYFKLRKVTVCRLNRPNCTNTFE